MIATPDWGPLSNSWREPSDVYGKHHAPGSSIPECELEMLRRAERVRRHRHNFGEHYFPAQHSLSVGAGVKLTVAELIERCGR